MVGWRPSRTTGRVVVRGRGCSSFSILFAEELALVEIGKAVLRVKLAAVGASDGFDRILRTRAVEKSSLMDCAVPFERLDARHRPGERLSGVGSRSMN
jgi:hypothetical protein